MLANFSGSQLTDNLTEVRKSCELDYLLLMEIQVTVDYEDGKPSRIDTIGISTAQGRQCEQIRKDVIEK